MSMFYFGQFAPEKYTIKLHAARRLWISKLRRHHTTYTNYT